MSDRPFDMPPSTTRAYEPIRGAWVIRRLMAEPGLGITNVIHAAAVVGSLAGESRLTAIQEVSPIAGRGGFGWEQATGDRRVAFEDFAAAQGMKVTDDRANYEFLVSELLGPEARAWEATKETTTLEDAVYTFEARFERPSSLSDAGARTRYAQQAIDAMGDLPAAVPSGPVFIPAGGTKPPPVVIGKLGSPDVTAAAMRLLQIVLAVDNYYSGPIDGHPSEAMYNAMDAYAEWLDRPTS